MSVFTPVDVEAPFDRKKQLVSRLLQQLQQNAQRGAGMPGMGGARGVLGTGVRPGHPLGGAALVTQMPASIAPALQRLLGPGGFGHPIPGREASVAPGQSIVSNLGSNPHAGGSVAAPPSAAPVPIPVHPAAPVPTPTSTGNPAAAPTSTAPIPLGNGIFYDPVNGVLINHNAGPTSASGANGGTGGSRTVAV